MIIQDQERARIVPQRDLDPFKAVGGEINTGWILSPRRQDNGGHIGIDARTLREMARKYLPRLEPIAKEVFHRWLTQCA